MKFLLVRADSIQLPAKDLYGESWFARKYRKLLGREEKPWDSSAGSKDN